MCDMNGKKIVTLNNLRKIVFEVREGETFTRYFLKYCTNIQKRAKKDFKSGITNYK